VRCRTEDEAWSRYIHAAHYRRETGGHPDSKCHVINVRSQGNRDQAGESDAVALTRAALEHTQEVLRDSEELLDRAKDLSQLPDENADRDDRDTRAYEG
jgi:hypothetical protein